MVWMAALYLTASPIPGSSSPMCVFVVLQAASPRTPRAASRRRGLKDMAVILFKTDRLLLGHAAGSRWRRRRHRRLHESPRGHGHARVRLPVEQQVGLVGGSYPLGW